MTPEDIKDLKIMMATFKFEICERVREEVSRLIDSTMKERWKAEDARRRESTW
jgi:hypothetical protein